MTVCRVVVVGAGVSGLVAARELTKHPELEVICLEGSDRVGGQLHTLEIDGAAVDVGAEAIHLGAPHVAALVRELGLAERVVGAARGASVMGTRKGLRPLPAGVGPTGPTKIWPVLKSGILTPRGLLRAGLEPLMARRRVPEDVTVGSFTQGRFGKEVTDTFVDPLLGNLHGGDVHRLSLQATAPQLVADASNGTSMLLKNLHLPAPLAGLAARVRRTPALGSPRPRCLTRRLRAPHVRHLARRPAGADRRAGRRGRCPHRRACHRSGARGAGLAGPGGGPGAIAGRPRAAHRARCRLR